jgi:glutaconate CoA-transferase subunit A
VGVSEEAALAARAVILTCEELVDAEVILSDPNRILLPETKVVAVVPEPGGAHPSPLQGHWRRDHVHYREYAERSRSAEGFQTWLQDWVLGVGDRAAYLRRLDLEAIRIRRSLFSAPVNYGDE